MTGNDYDNAMEIMTAGRSGAWRLDTELTTYNYDDE